MVRRGWARVLCAACPLLCRVPRPGLESPPHAVTTRKGARQKPWAHMAYYGAGRSSSLTTAG
eukprot:1157725-Prymnesium_polylepis.1